MREGGAVHVKRALIGAHELGDRNAAIDQIFPMIARVVPAAGNIQRVVAGPGNPINPFRAFRGKARDAPVALIDLALARRRDVPGRPGIGFAGNRAVDSDTGTHGIEVVERVARKRLIEAASDGEGEAYLAVRFDAVAFSGLGEAAEIDDMDVKP